METITITHHEGFDELVAPQGLCITEAGEIPDDSLRTFSTRRTCAPGTNLAQWRTATTQEKQQYEAQIREQFPDNENPVQP